MVAAVVCTPQIKPNPSQKLISLVSRQIYMKFIHIHTTQLAFARHPLPFLSLAAKWALPAEYCYAIHVI